MTNRNDHLDGLLQQRHDEMVADARAKLAALDAWIEHFHARDPQDYEWGDVGDLMDLCDHLDEFLKDAGQ